MATDQELSDIEDAIVADMEAGVSTTAIDGTSVSYTDPVKRLEALEKLERRDARNSAQGVNTFGLRMIRLKPGGCG